MIFAKVDVRLRDHIKAQRAGVAMSTWAWGLLYARGQETDGSIPSEALRGAWVGEEEARKHAAKLVAVGLWEKADDGWTICHYGEKNETSQAISERRIATKERVARFRNSSRPPPGNADGNAVTNVLHLKRCNAVVPDSDSDSDLKISEGEFERGIPSRADVPPSVTSVVRRTVEPSAAPDPAADAPDWWPGVIATIASGTAVDLPAREAWLRYAGHRASKARPAERRDAVHWLTTVMVKEARENREQARIQRERDAKFDRRRAGPAPPSDTQKLTEAEQRELAERFPMPRRDRGAE